MLMYNRYIPQPDGTYRKHRINTPIQEKESSEPIQQPRIPDPPPCCPKPDPPCSPPYAENKPHKPPIQSGYNIGQFFKRLLPKELDTADLLIILLLLLMAGDCEDDKNTALLTLALYFFL